MSVCTACDCVNCRCGIPTRTRHRRDCPGAPLCTLHSQHSEADICQLRGWAVGDTLVGDEGYGDKRIRITAIGEEEILVRSLDTLVVGWDGSKRPHESTHLLRLRCWGKAQP